MENAAQFPARLQRTRKYSPGIPLGAVYVGRPSQWGNPAKIGEWYWSEYGYHSRGEKALFVENRILAVDLFYQYAQDYFHRDPEGFTKWIIPLAGHNLCCWCPAGESCHGDVLIYLAGLINDGAFQKPDTWPGLNEITKGKI